MILGHSGKAFNRWSEILALSLSRIEALIDFGEDERLEAEVLHKVVLDVTRLRDEIRSSLESQIGSIIRTGVQLAIVGPPNAGKT